MLEFRRTLAACLVTLLAACSGPGTPTPGTPTPTPTPNPAPGPNPNPAPTPVFSPNNSAVLTGAALGAGTTPNSELQKVLSVSPSPNPAFRLGAAYAARTGPDAQTLYWFVEITNDSGRLQCLVGATNIELRDSAGTVIAVDELDFVSGSVGFGPLEEGAGYTDTCLAAGAAGYLSGTVTEDEAPSAYALVSAVTLAALTGAGGFTAPAARLIPQSYTVTGSVSGGVSDGDTDSEFAVTVQNEGTGAATLGQNSVYFLLDEAGHPLFWDNFADDGAGLSVAPGGTQRLSGPLAYRGQAARLQVQLSFEGP